jgi:hypothetical protein
MAYVVRRDGRFCAVVYDGLDPLTGRERRRWHPAGQCRADAEALAANLDRALTTQHVEPRSAGQVSVGRFLTEDWLPAKRLALRRLRAEHLEGFYGQLLETGRARGGGLSPKTVVEVHAMVRSALRTALRKRLVRVNVA